MSPDEEKDWDEKYKQEVKSIKAFFKKIDKVKLEVEIDDGSEEE